MPLLFLALFLLTGVQSFAQDYPVLSFSTRLGLASSRVNDGLQDRMGNIWLATEEGVSRFDGQDFRNYSQAEGLTGDAVLNVFQDRRSRIWLTLANGEVNLIDKERVFNRFSMPVLAGLRSRSGFHGFAEDGQGNLWFSTPADGVFILTARNAIRVLRPKMELPAALLAPGMWTGPDNQIRIGSDAGILNLSTEPMVPELAFRPPGGKIDFLTASRAGILLMSAAGSLYTRSLPERDFHPVPSSEVPLREGATHIREDPEGGLWISTPAKILHVEPPGSGPLNCRVLFAGRKTGPVFFDRQENPWICTRDEGVLLVTSHNELRFGREHGLPGTPLRLGLSPGRIWIGTGRGETGYLCGSGYNSVTAGLPDDPGPVRDFYFRKESDQTFVVAENALIRCEPQKKPALIYGDFRALATDGAGNLVAGTRTNARSLTLPPDQQTGPAVFGSEPLLPPCRVNDIKTESDGSLWFATSLGLFTRQNGRVIYLKDRFPELGNSMQHLVSLGDNRVIAASSGTGLFIFQGEKLEKAGLAEGLPSLHFRSLRKTGEDSVLICTAGGISLLTFLGDGSFLKVRSLHPGRLMPETEVFDALVSGDTLVAATSEGVSLFPHFLQPETPGTEKTRIALVGTGEGNLQPFTESGRVTIRAGEKIRLVLENFDFRNFGRVRYRYRLLPDTTWFESQSRYISLSIPEQGDFQLEIQSRTGSGGGWEAVAPPLPVQATGPFLRSPLFWPTLAGGLVILFLLLRRLPGLYRKAGKRIREGNPKPIRYQPLYLALPLLKAWLHFLAGRLAENNPALALNLLHKIRHFYNLLDRNKAEPSLLDELRLLQRFLDAENLCLGTQMEIPFPEGADTRSAAITPFPPFLLINLCRAAIFLCGPTGRGEKGPEIQLSLIRIGGIFQFTAEVLSLPEKQLWPKSFFQHFAGLTHEIQLQADGAGRKDAGLEVFYPHIQENRLTGSRFQIWIPVKGSPVSSS